MATFCIGDIHGAANTLDNLLARLEHDAPGAQFWFVGDLVNRGPDSAAVLRRVRGLGKRAITLLGNHDLALLALVQQPDARKQANASLQPLLDAPDCDTLLDWLRHRPLIHHDASLNWTMVHAGIPAEWSTAQAQARAAELETALRGPDHGLFLRHLFGNTPEKWDPALIGAPRLRYITNALTRQRFVHADRRLNMVYKKTLAGAPADLTPWFAMPKRASADERIVFGHWSALEHIAWPQHHVWGIDTGAAWGGQLTALRLDTDTPQLIQVDCERLMLSHAHRNF